MKKGKKNKIFSLNEPNQSQDLVQLKYLNQEEDKIQHNNSFEEIQIQLNPNQKEEKKNIVPQQNHPEQQQQIELTVNQNQIQAINGSQVGLKQGSQQNANPETIQQTPKPSRDIGWFGRLKRFIKKNPKMTLLSFLGLGGMASLFAYLFVDAGKEQDRYSDTPPENLTLNEIQCVQNFLSITDQSSYDQTLGGNYTNIYLNTCREYPETAGVCPCILNKIGFYNEPDTSITGFSYPYSKRIFLNQHYNGKLYKILAHECVHLIDNKPQGVNSSMVPSSTKECINKNMTKSQYDDIKWGVNASSSQYNGTPFLNESIETEENAYLLSILGSEGQVKKQCPLFYKQYQNITDIIRKNECQEIPANVSKGNSKNRMIKSQTDTLVGSSSIPVQGYSKVKKSYIPQKEKQVDRELGQRVVKKRGR